MSPSPHTAARRDAPPTTLASAALPPRVRHLLGAVNALAAQYLSTSLELALNELERQLFKQAERARSSQHQAECFAELQYLRQHRADLIPRYLAALEAELARLREAPMPEAPAEEPEDPLQYQRLTLVEDTDLDRDIVLREIARHQAQRGGTPLLLLGQRFGVLAARPAFDPERLPIGPFALCRILREAGESLRMNLDSQLLLYRMFERQVMDRYGELVGRLNTLLAHEGVLPGLAYLPYRPRTAGQSRRPARPGAPGAPGTAGTPRPRPLTGWQGQGHRSDWNGALLAGLPEAPQAPPGVVEGGAATAAAPASPGARPGLPEQAVFGALQGMLSAHRQANTAGGATPRQAPGRILPLDAVTNALGTLQSAPPARLPGKRRRTMDDLHHSMLEHVRQSHGPEAGLSQEHSDTFELLGMLYREIGREVHRNAPAQDLLERLQVPVARAAVQDRSFFVRDQHPARELLNSVAESGATWLADDDADPQLVQRLERAVDRVVEEYDGDEAVFERANREVQEHHRAQARKAEVGERRQVEAARGRDRLETAKHRAAEAIAARLGGRKPPQFVQALLGQAWADVLTLTALRHGEDSPEWRERDEATSRIVEITCAPDAPADPALAGQIDTALRQVGYHADEASAISRRLSRSEDDETTSRTELTAKLKARTRLGEGEQAEARGAHLPPRSDGEQACYERLRTLPFGTWFEFVSNQQGDVRRQRLSWYSPVTDNALFVNARGHKVGEHSLDALARLMAQGQARIVTEDRGRLIDRAWHATLRTLRGLAGGRAAPSADGTEVGGA
ncbi:thymidine phosphorylase [Pseudoxanthomonas broegbernensis]|uniref:Thymidine phosphorylase n=1 Tax=Pseudoxanthomonas broegbernensis TaxID=83619 RepID=A0A7V8GLV7_9GAMM|nr:DUF1631 domain-containing protein [Pseudoxanthomonas broegbernensis]KAF1686113.1 thymidine phosphorylase [Pseudoxanthomonas broegbernensis]MBB6063808.1 hypothetical protein [Pseudoxanthomonas broegbernensis]